ncbi:DUF4258 domain-containing protein [candidate division WOR-3 bacterium]|nr:DUF4258 domain-containing protein [candidate division WOR-3 bacterium]
MNNILQKIRELFSEGKYELTLHAIKRMDERGIWLDEISSAIMEGKIIKSYPNDRPYPSHLIQGYTRGESLYILCALGEEMLYIVTTHWLTPKEWVTP